MTFAPCLLWILVGAPFVELLRGNRAIAGALAAITAAVVGVILNLAIWFGVHTIFREVAPVSFAGGVVDVPVLASVDPVALGLTGGAMVMIFRFKVSMIPTLLASALAGMAWYVVVR